MLLIALLTLLVTSSEAQDYTLYQAENSTYQDYSRAELMHRLGPDSALLPAYVCDSKNEHEVFWPGVRSNPLRTSLRIKAYESEQVIVYQDGKFLTPAGESETELSNIFVAYVVQALKKIEAFPEGKSLLRELERSRYPLTIVHGGNSFNPHDNQGRSYHGIYQANALAIFSHGRMTNEDISFDGIGAGGKIGWNPKAAEFPVHVALAHEMYHAYDSVRGLLDMRIVIGPKYEQAFVSEYRAVYLENLARRSAGFKLRTHYGQDQVGPGMLDEAGEPIRMPSPCLKD